jgi:hypothetical protein
MICGIENHTWGEKILVNQNVYSRMITPGVDGSDFGPAYDPDNYVTTIESIFEVKCLKCGQIMQIKEFY